MKWKDLPTLGYTHFQPAQLTTVGKRATLWAQDLAHGSGRDRIPHRHAALPRRQGNHRHAGVVPLASSTAITPKSTSSIAMVTERFGFDESFTVTGQTYPRKVDAQVVCALAGIAASVHQFCNDIRLLAGMKQIEEPFEEEQVGSSAMAYKRNPMRCERATGLARFVISLVDLAPANRRRAMVRAHAGRFIATSAWPSPSRSWRSTAACRSSSTSPAAWSSTPKPSKRPSWPNCPSWPPKKSSWPASAPAAIARNCTSCIRKHSLAAAEQVKMHGKPNDLIERFEPRPGLSRHQPRPGHEPPPVRRPRPRTSRCLHRTQIFYQ